MSDTVSRAEWNALKAVVTDLSSKVGRFRANSGGAVEVAQAPVASGPGLHLVAPVTLGSGDDLDWSTDWVTVNCLPMASVGSSFARISIVSRMTDQANDKIARLSVRRDEFGSEYLVHSISAGNQDDTSAIGIFDAPLTSAGTFDIRWRGYRNFTDSTREIGAETDPDSRFAWSIELIGYWK